MDKDWYSAGLQIYMKVFRESGAQLKLCSSIKDIRAYDKLVPMLI